MMYGQSTSTQVKASLMSMAEVSRLAEPAELVEVPRYLSTWAGKEQKSCHIRYQAELAEVPRYLGTWAGDEQKSWEAGHLGWLSWLGWQSRLGKSRQVGKSLDYQMLGLGWATHEQCTFSVFNVLPRCEAAQAAILLVGAA